LLDTLILLNILPRIQTENMPKTTKVKKKVTKSKTKTSRKSKVKAISKPQTKIAVKTKEINKGPIKISKTYIPKDNEKYMCEKHKVFF